MVVKQVDRKVTRVGNSLGITLPVEVLEHLGVLKGDDLVFNLEEDGKVSFKKNEKISLNGIKGVDQDFADGLNHLFDNYDEALKNLADR